MSLPGILLMQPGETPVDTGWYLVATKTGYRMFVFHNYSISEEDRPMPGGDFVMIVGEDRPAKWDEFTFLARVFPNLMV